jgi:CBS domain-containing protein
MLRTTVSDVMASDIVTASPDASFAELARLLHGAGVRAVPIVDRAGVLLGVVSEADLMASAARPDTAPGRWRARHVRRDQPEAKAGATTAAELMTPFVEAVAPTTTVATAARLMVERHLRWMPVCDAAGCVLGVVSRSDVLSIFLRDDESIRAEIADEVLGGRAVQVDVHDGICSLAGEVRSRSDAEGLVRAVERVEGVVAVEDHLTHRSTEQLVEGRSDVREERVL